MAFFLITNKSLLRLASAAVRYHIASTKKKQAATKNYLKRKMECLEFPVSESSVILNRKDLELALSEVKLSPEQISAAIQRVFRGIPENAPYCDAASEESELKEVDVPADVDVNAMFFLSAKAFSIDWNKPEEDEAWKDL